MRVSRGEKVVSERASGVRRKIFTAFLLPLAILLNTAPAFADVNDVQIDWMIAQKDWATVSPDDRGQRISFNFRMLPSTLYVTDDEEDGTKLLPAGTQLYAMTGLRLAACSQLAAKQPYVGATKRICFRDDDGDGTLDTYWLRFPLQQLLGKGNWLFLNGEIPIQRSRIIHPHLRTVASDLAEKSGVLSLGFFLSTNGSVSGSIWVKDGETFTGNCPLIGYESDSLSKQWCLIPDLIVQGVNFHSKIKAERRMEFVRPQRDVQVRFTIRQGLLGFSAESIYLK